MPLSPEATSVLQKINDDAKAHKKGQSFPRLPEISPEVDAELPWLQRAITVVQPALDEPEPTLQELEKALDYLKRDAGKTLNALIKEDSRVDQDLVRDAVDVLKERISETGKALALKKPSSAQPKASKTGAEVQFDFAMHTPAESRGRFEANPVGGGVLAVEGLQNEPKGAGFFVAGYRKPEPPQHEAGMTYTHGTFSPLPGLSDHDGVQRNAERAFNNHPVVKQLLTEKGPTNPADGDPDAGDAIKPPGVLRKAGELLEKPNAVTKLLKGGPTNPADRAPDQGDDIPPKPEGGASQGAG